MQGSLAYRLLLKKSKTNSEYKNGTFTLNAFSRWLSLFPSWQTSETIDQ
jgi:hypothetical protein